jgi:hypothetical protein
MKILVACEESQAVTIEFRKLDINYTCKIVFDSLEKAILFLEKPENNHKVVWRSK